MLTLLLLPLTSFAQGQSAPTVQKVENAGLLFTDNNAGVSGTDAGYSIPLPHQTLWLFGDVFLLDPQSPTKTYVGGVSNCAALVAKGAGVAPLRTYAFLTDNKSGVARQVIPLSAEEPQNDRVWPYGGWYNPGDKRIYLYYARIHPTGGGAFDFQTVGHGLASADAAKPEALQFVPVPAAPNQPIWWTGEKGKTLFGCAAVAGETDDYLYLAGVQERGGGKRGKLARVPKNRIADFTAYTYYAGADAAPQWSKSAEAAADIAGLSDFPNELSIAYNAYLGGYLAVHSVGISDKARLSLAAHPWGPYQQIAEIPAPHRAFSKAFCYAGKEHPELAEERGRVVYITYVDSERYWLRMLRVTLLKGK